ncbi:hypothetical protein AYL99_01020 [Fonsecaea erecta]|uniref:CMP/dCMP-type deaminase domain-containing protein n=1 Tax=Fonsecaea erecta TaxID=1367422 RepID=A0A178ZYZ5_9EURO|nr:hypothetical protein AYL99_01020 [Fonsecaea erecta]OAP65048.1 hypothetical protein AYL99_01020 [Fonsecaea erecta]
MSSTTEPSQSTHLHYLRHALSLARQSPPKPTNFCVGCVIVSFPRQSSSSSSTSSGQPAENDEDENDNKKAAAAAAAAAAVEGEVLATGYTLELEGNTHAEQNALTKLARQHALTPPSASPSPADLERLGQLVLTPDRNVHLYTTLEPCGKRLSGNVPCVQRIIATTTTTTTTSITGADGGSGGGGGGGIRKVVFGAHEPGTFVQDSQSLKMLDAAGVAWEYVPGLDEEILSVAKAGHVPGEAEGEGASSSSGAVATAAAKDKGTNVDDISPEERRRQEALPRNPKKRMMEVDVPPS